MVTQNPVFFDPALSVHRPMDAGAQIPSTAVPISASQGNLVQAFSDGLYVGNQNGLALYVDSVNGSDSNPGTTKSSPLKTIDRAFTMLSGMFPIRYSGQNIVIALKANQSYPVTGEFFVYPDSSIFIAFYGDPNYGDWNSAPIGTGANPWNMADLQRPVIQPQVSQVNGLWKLAGITCVGGDCVLQGVTIQLPAAPAAPSIALYGGYVDFVRYTSGSPHEGSLSLDGVIVNMTDVNAYWGIVAVHARAAMRLFQFCTQFQIGGKLMNAANSPTTAQLQARQYFIKFFQDFAGNNQQALYLSTATSNSSGGSGFVKASWTDASAMIVTGSSTNLASYPLSFDPGYGLINYIFGLTKTANGTPLNFISSRLF
jgi:hypothetical protein